MNPRLPASLRVLVALGLTAAAAAQNPFHGSGAVGAYIVNTPGVLGQQLVVGYGSPTTPLPICILGVSDGIGPTFVPGFGNLGIDLLSPAYQTFTFGLDANGDGAGLLTLPPGFPLPTDPPLFFHAATFELAGISVSKTVRVEWALPDAWEPTAPMATARQLHTATALATDPRDPLTEVLVCGGATGSIIVPVPLASAELYSPLTRSTTPLPSLLLPRASHRAVRLQDGRILITGGVTNGGLVTATCETFDPATNTFSLAGLMTTPRAGHAVTLLNDGRVLITGGVSDWQNAASQLTARLNTAQDSAELFDPVTGLFTPLPVMAAKRFGHSQTLLNNGRVLVVSGINGGSTSFDLSGNVFQVPIWTATCEVFDPASLTFAATTALGPFLPTQSRAFHGASLLPGGSVLVCGGLVQAQTQGSPAVAGLSCAVWDGINWSSTTSLPTAAAFATQVDFGGGALVMGGVTGDLTQLTPTGQVVLHDGVAVTSLAPLGTGGGAAQRGMHTCTPLYDGTFLVLGGAAWPSTLADGQVYTPN
ncbi:MAG: kelch repeat-containing protein [Planctomycetota bacterium]